MLGQEGSKEGGEGKGAQGRAQSPGKEERKQRSGGGGEGWSAERGAMARGAAGAAVKLVCVARLPQLQWRTLSQRSLS